MNSSSSAQPAQRSRLGYLDWARGVAAVVMIQGHVFHSFTDTSLRKDPAYIWSQFLGGMPAPIFLFLTGVTFAFLMHSLQRKDMAAGERVAQSLRRASYLFVLAFAFRIQLWLFGLPAAQLKDLFKVDILNCMGLALVVLSAMAVFSTAQRVWLCAAAGVAIAAASPLASVLDWSGVPNLMEMYLKPDAQTFPFFPSAAFVAFGMSFGSVVRLRERRRSTTTICWTAAAGAALVAGARYVDGLGWSLYSHSEYWLDSPILIFVKLGVVLLLIGIAYAWTEYGPGLPGKWMMLLGTHSLLVYWVHTELVYGVWMYPLKQELPIPATFVLTIGVIAAMFWLSYAKVRWGDQARAWRTSLIERRPVRLRTLSYKVPSIR